MIEQDESSDFDSIVDQKAISLEEDLSLIHEEGLDGDGDGDGDGDVEGSNRVQMSESIEIAILSHDSSIPELPGIASVLVVDDDLMNIQVLQGMLHGWKIKSDQAISGMVALQLIESRINQTQSKEKLELYDLILLDFSMPQLDGPATARLIRQMLAAKDLPQPYICCCTSYDEDSYTEQAYEAGMDQLMTKPVKSDNLFAMTKRILDLAKAHRQ